MADNELSENEIWEYKSKCRRKQCVGNGERTTSQGKSGKSQKNVGKKRLSVGSNNSLPSGNNTQAATTSNINNNNPKHDTQHQTFTPKKVSDVLQSPKTPSPRNEGYCPSCQMPFSLLLEQTPSWHVSECLDTAGLAERECPDGILCNSEIPSHYKLYTHYHLAQNRALNESVLSLNVTAPSTPKTAKLNLLNSPVSWSKISENINRLRNSPNNQRAKSFSPKKPNQKLYKDKSPSSSQGSVKLTCLDAWLSSPSKSEKSDSLSQEISPQAADIRSADLSDYEISYSPIMEDQVISSDGEEDTIRRLFSNDPIRGDFLRTKDELYETQDKYHCGSNKGSGRIKATEVHPGNSDLSKITNNFNSDFLHANKDTATCAVNRQQRILNDHADWSEFSSPESVLSEWKDCNQTETEHLIGGEPIPANKSVDSPSLLSIAPQQTQGKKNNILPLSQKFPAMPNKSPKGQTSSKGLKQMDIGVFFGLKPKAKKEKEDTKLPLKDQKLNDATKTRKRKAQGSVGEQDPLINNVNTEREGTGGSYKGGGKRFRQSSTGEGVRGKKQCPFYKKIPGTGFAVDAFQYGEIEGCTAYFLTHFHSDHYGGLTKKFRFPIYCSKITGNLVQNKLRVEQEFINTLPMNTECTVNGIRVVLLEANHCPGAVLILFHLPNGTSVLHTGDFRADPTMEKYPALIGQKIHTLYLDTTYCSPEYTFPPQQEVIQFAANAAFETVALHPRTLVVCGTYSVGKEKVFLGRWHCRDLSTRNLYIKANIPSYNPQLSLMSWGVKSACPRTSTRPCSAWNPNIFAPL
ncbi:hypothetical protein GDO86_019750 [Hymenochirus boettgeri]|uniref:UBZ4-type domain-containing protein n=1 Tax=Hymenochirus boettgeri TaxID=247094 RepID=A0A8T2IFW3_9PIPI|nr:hypothetical protein GDO86_019750 [Hymenochirus boettgeri]